LLVQNCTELLATALEEICVMVIFAPSPRGDHTHIDQSAIHGLYFHSARPICEKSEILHHAKISRYTVSEVCIE
jgi:hypothetical protein